MKIVVYVLLLMLSGCALKNSQVIGLGDDLLHTYQADNQCGPNALSIVMRYWDVDKTPSKIAEKIYQPYLKGTYSLSMLFYAKSLGLDAFLYKGNIEDLRKKIDDGYPMLLAIKYENMPVHYIVAYGYKKNKIVIHDGLKYNVFITQKRLKQIWKTAGFMTLWVYKKGDRNVL